MPLLFFGANRPEKPKENIAKATGDLTPSFITSIRNGKQDKTHALYKSHIKREVFNPLRLFRMKEYVKDSRVISRYTQRAQTTKPDYFNGFLLGG